MTAEKTYLLCPSFAFQPGGPICLGNIIADPSRPTKVLSKLDPSQNPDIVTTPEFDYAITSDKSYALYGGVWARFLQAASVKAGAEHNSDIVAKYTMDSMEVSYFKDDPTDEEVAERVKDRRVKTAIKAGLFGPQPLYMITGLRIAKGLRHSSEISLKQEGSIGAGTQLTDQVSVGGETGGGQRTTWQESGRSGVDVIFAYQLHVIAQRGWRKKRTVIDLYVPDAAFLNNDREETQGEPMEARLATEADLREINADSDSMTFNAVKAQDGNQTCVCISF
ncbi:hypothetical protein IMSHALPRED_003358 [Imshaugia aleurites]|uniref:Uncharacterized protein n=1 Tax=Imshaugia aleurites TaxID=172621 RepID=A0A8H3F6K3_9LECA|nr:hypothetical protein IMSHALPRED_003358 [Imshaugia aleurites]